MRAVHAPLAMLRGLSAWRLRVVAARSPGGILSVVGRAGANQVSVGFVRKFPRFVSLEELRSFGGPGQPLQNMALLRRGRLSVQRVTPAEYDFVCSLGSSAS